MRSKGLPATASTCPQSPLLRIEASPPDTTAAASAMNGRRRDGHILATRWPADMHTDTRGDSRAPVQIQQQECISSCMKKAG
jgi:hypothetical protein